MWVGYVKLSRISVILTLIDPLTVSPTRKEYIPHFLTLIDPLVSRHNMMGPNSAAGRISIRLVMIAGWSSSHPRE